MYLRRQTIALFCGCPRAPVSRLSPLSRTLPPPLYLDTIPRSTHRITTNSNPRFFLKLPSRCDIADDLYRKAKARGAVPHGTGWLPWAADHTNGDNDSLPPNSDGTTTTTSRPDSSLPQRGAQRDSTANDANGAAGASPPGGFGRGGESEKTGGGGYGRESEEERMARESDAARLLSDAVGYYRLAAEAEEENGVEGSGGDGGGAGKSRGLFSLGWMHQVGWVVSALRGSGSGDVFLLPILFFCASCAVVVCFPDRRSSFTSARAGRYCIWTCALVFRVMIDRSGSS